MLRFMFGVLMLLIAGVQAGYAANWTESFTGGTPDQAWDLVATDLDGEEQTDIDWPVVNSGSVFGEFRDPFNVALPNPDTIVEAFGVVDMAFTDVTVSGWINLDPEPGNRTDVGLLARVNVVAGEAYVFGVSLDDGAYAIGKFADEADELIELAISDTDGDPAVALPTDIPLYLVFVLTGDMLVGHVLDAPGGNVLGQIAATDGDYVVGSAGVFARIDDDGPAGSQIIGSFDDIRATGVPEPASLGLLAFSTALVGFKRRARGLATP